MKILLPRVIRGNRGDLASRWGVLKALELHGHTELSVFRHLEGDIPKQSFPVFPYGSLRNFQPAPESRQAFREGELVLWAVGLDMQDDSSLAKLLFLWFLFARYKLQGLKIIALFQGAGPIRTRLGRWLARRVLNRIDHFVARDPGTAALVHDLAPSLAVTLAHDAIFLPGLEEECDLDQATELITSLGDRRPIVGLNLRQWFHLTSSLLPYEISKNAYRDRAEGEMEALLDAGRDLVENLRRDLDARVFLISAYQTGVVAWEDDLPWLARVSQTFADDQDVCLLDQPMSIPTYFGVMSKMDLMIGMRLHSTLIALRFGVPAINISYTLKGRDIMSHLGLADHVFGLEEFIADPARIARAGADLLANGDASRRHVREAVQQAITENNQILANLLGK
jgi:polysaccharide pyruvyl transferase WcaK-like protein